MKLVCISDTHGYHDHLKLPYGDVLIHAGDCTNDIGQASLREFLTWMERQKGYYAKILVAGNHDGAFQKWPKEAGDMVRNIAPSVTYLEESGTEVNGVKFWGSPYTPTFFDWFFMADRGKDIKAHWDKIPEGTDVLVTHGPPNGFLDLSNHYNPSTGKKFDDHLGCEELAKAVERIKPKAHVFGHIHGSYGFVAGPNTTYVNPSFVDEAYIPNRQPIVVEI